MTRLRTQSSRQTSTAMGNVYTKRWHKRLHQATRWVLIALAVAGSTLCWQCTGKEKGEPTVAAYYWSTVFHLDSTQRTFINDQNIKRIYLRYFDVVMKDGSPMPNATVQVQSQKPDSIEIVPTVFIVNNCMTTAQPKLDSLLLTRILQMSETHDLGPIHEIQIDCDWTKQTRGNYFTMLEQLRKRAAKKDIKVSVTIRLHQLSQTPPPADRGVLMMYNTGDVTQFNGTDPILDMRDVNPYLKSLADYGLPLATAYPVFAWQVVFRKDGSGEVGMQINGRGEKSRLKGRKKENADKNGGWRYIGILHRDEYLPMLPGDSIVTRQPTPDMVRLARQAIDSLRPDANREIIIYDISKQNIQRIKQYHYEKILNSHTLGNRALAD